MSASRKSPPAKAAAAKPPAPRWHLFVACSLIVLAVLAVYGNSLGGPFIFDDELWIMKNPTIRQLWPIGPVLWPPAGTIYCGRPVLNLSLALNHSFSGLEVWSYHAANLAIHLIAGLALFGIVRRTLLARKAGTWRVHATPLAFFSALLWAVHPLQTESVTYVIQRAESLMGMFYLLTLYCFIRGTEDSAAGNQRAENGNRRSSFFWFLGSVFCCVLGMATKEVMVSAPLMVFLYDCTFAAGSFREAWRRRWRVHLALAGTWLVLGVLMSGLGGRGVGTGLGFTWWTYALTECPAVVHYLSLAIWPHPLVIDYGDEAVRHIAEVAPYGLILLALVAATVIALWRRPTWGFIGAWFFVILAPTSSVVPVAFQPMAEHRMYLPLAGVAVSAVLGVHAWLGRRGAVVCGALVLGFGAITVARNRDYRSVLAIWNDTVEKQPGNPRAQYYLGLTLAQTGRVSEALAHFQEAAHLKQDYADAYNNVGTSLFLLGRVPEAVEQYEKALAFKPVYPDAERNLGAALFNLGRFEEAARHFQAAVRLQPEDVAAHTSLAAAFARLGRTPEAIAQCEAALRLRPDDARIHCDLANMLVRVGRLADARSHYEQALRIDPNLAEARNNLVRLQADQSSANQKK